LFGAVSGAVGQYNAALIGMRVLASSWLIIDLRRAPEDAGNHHPMLPSFWQRYLM
jgi:hypothetical protein